MTANRLSRISVVIALALPLSANPATAGMPLIDSQYGYHSHSTRSSGAISVLFDNGQAELSAIQDEIKAGHDQFPPEENWPTGIMDDTAPGVAEKPAGEAVAANDQALVREIQELLSVHGFDAGPADGIIGPKTTKAITAYQESAGLRADGRPSRELLELLRSKAGNAATETTIRAQEPETAMPEAPVAAPDYDTNPQAESDMPLNGTIWSFTDEAGSSFVLEFAPDGAVKGVLYEKFWAWRQAAEQVEIFYDNGMGLKVSRSGKIQAGSMSGLAQPSRGEAWSWTAERIFPPAGDAAPAETAQPPSPPEPYAEQPGPADSSDPVEVAPADSSETETLAGADTQPASDIEASSPLPESSPDEVVHTEQPVPEPPTIPDAVAQSEMAATSDFESDNKTISEDAMVRAKRKPRAYGEDNPNDRIVIRAVEESWVEVTDTDGEILFSRVLRKGDSYRAPAGQGATLVTGNAGGLEIIVDGQPAPALGPVGVVRRGVALDSERLKSGDAWPPAPAEKAQAQPPETKPGEVIQTEQSASEPPTAPDEIAQPPAPVTSEFENDNQAPSEDVTEKAERKPRVYGEDNPDGRIVIRAVEEAWVEVTDTDGEILFSRVLRKGDSYRAAAGQGATFVTGNAGGLEIIVDGQPAPALGPVGVVRRGVALDSERLKSGDAWPSARGDTARP